MYIHTYLRAQIIRIHSARITKVLCKIHNFYHRFAKLLANQHLPPYIHTNIAKQNPNTTFWSLLALKSTGIAVVKFKMQIANSCKYFLYNFALHAQSHTYKYIYSYHIFSSTIFCAPNAVTPCKQTLPESLI